LRRRLDPAHTRSARAPRPQPIVHISADGPNNPLAIHPIGAANRRVLKKPQAAVQIDPALQQNRQSDNRRQTARRDTSPPAALWHNFLRFSLSFAK
jgi:hypothetical protein